MLEAPQANIDLDNNFWNADTVTAVVAAKKEKRNLKNKVVNLFVLKEQDPDSGAKEVDEFISTLRKSIDEGKFEQGGRFQLALQSGAHWTAFDVTIKDNKLHIISIDSANDPSESRHIDAFKEQFPEASFYCFDGNPNNIQYDNNSCSRFTLDTLFKMENLADPISIMEAVVVEHNPRKLKNYKNPDGGPEYRIKSSQFPAEMAFIFRNTQSWGAINALPPEIQNAPVNQKGDTLLEYAESGSVMVQKEDGSPKKQHKSIDNVKHDMSAYTRSYLQHKSSADIDQLVSERKGLDFISKSNSQRVEQDQAQKQRFAPDKKIEKMTGDYVKNHDKPSDGIFNSFFRTFTQESRNVTAAKAISERVHNGHELSEKELNQFSALDQECQEVANQYRTARAKLK